MKILLAVFLLALLSLNGCNSNSHYEETKQYFLEKETSMVVQVKKGTQERVFDVPEKGKYRLRDVYELKGYEPTIKTVNSYRENNSLFMFVWEATELGDTLVKLRNKGFYLLKKKGHDIKFGFDTGMETCEGNLSLGVTTKKQKKNAIGN